MKTFLLGGAAAILLGSVAPAIAQAPVAPIRQAKIHTRSEVVAKVQQRFARVDANHDGLITQAEMQAAPAHKGQRKGMRARRGGNADAMFARLDANHDGSISRAEFDAGHQKRAEHLAAGGGDQAAGRGGMGMHMFAMADANKDGQITLAEAQSAALKHFDMVDANRDGQITPEERQQMRAHRQHPAG